MASVQPGGVYEPDPYPNFGEIGGIDPSIASIIFVAVVVGLMFTVIGEKVERGGSTVIKAVWPFIAIGAWMTAAVGVLVLLGQLLGF